MEQGEKKKIAITIERNGREKPKEKNEGRKVVEKVKKIN